MSVPHVSEEVAAHLERAQQSLEAAHELIRSGYHDFAASRAYYGAFYAATAMLLSEGVELSKHSGVIAQVHQRLVKTGRLSKEHGRDLNWLFELRSVGDYGGVAHVSCHQSEQAVEAAARLVDAIRALMQNK
jgi:uncharacterized protein (UPF0332 family)